MKKFIPALFFIGFFMNLQLPVVAQSFPGRWEGMLSHAGSKLRIVFNIEDQNGKLNATFDSPDQGARGIKVDKIHQKEDSISLFIPQIGASFLGKYQAKPEKMIGYWKQANLELPVTFVRTEEEPELKRPQLPKDPLPYHSEDVNFPNKAAGINLAGTFTRPKVPGQYPAVVLITGSGPQDRDETIMDHKPFLILADHLSREGFAVLRYDDRGFGQSTGNFTNSTTLDFASDVIAAIDYLQDRPDVQAGKIGLIGHSEGGIIAPLVANTKPAVRFQVLLASPVIPGHELIVLQNRAIREAQENSEEEIKHSLEIQKKVLDIIRHETNTKIAAEKLKGVLEEAMKLESGDVHEVSSSSALISGQVAQLLSPWFRYFISYDPGSSFSELDIPTLAIYGTKDLQVPARENSMALQRIITELKKENIRVEILEGLNHLMQPANSGLPQEYNQIETTFAPEALSLITDWLKAQINQLD